MSAPAARTVVLTFDNLGAAAQVEAGLVAEGLDERGHPSLRALPGLLGLLAERELPATFFVEARNCELHPAAVTSIAAAGHEVAHHAWRHERWADLDPAAEAGVLERGVAAFARLGLRVRGFRPPGGALHPTTTGTLRGLGLDWCSPEGDAVTRLADDVVSLPFRWELVDAVYRYEPFAALREAHGLGAALVAPEATAGALWSQLLDDPDPVAATLVLHPLLMAGDGEPEAHHGLLRRLADARDAGRIRVVGGAALADELRATDESSGAGSPGV